MRSRPYTECFQVRAGASTAPLGLIGGMSWRSTSLATAQREVLFALAELQARVDCLIQERLAAGQIAAADRDVLLDVVRRLAQRGAEAVVLACTELPLLLSGAEGPTIIDAVDLHAEALCDLISSRDAA